MKYRDLLEKTDEFFKYVTNDYIKIAKVHKVDAKHLKLTFATDKGARNAYNDIFKDCTNHDKYTIIIGDDNNKTVDILIGIAK